MSWAEFGQDSYSEVRKLESKFGLVKPKGSLRKIYVKGFTVEQVSQVAIYITLFHIAN